MRIDGTLARWNDQSGFGFITPANGGPDVFVHISAFPLDGLRPIQGERLSFEILTGEDGTKRAHALQRPSRPASTRRPGKRKGGLLGRLILLIAFGLLAYIGYTYYTRHAASFPQLGVGTDDNRVALRPASLSADAPAPAPSYHCDGRTYCSQMNSCAEATWFLNNCPGVKMDGNHDGVPCEKQWCR